MHTVRTLVTVAAAAGLAACGHGAADPRVGHDETLLSVTATGQADTRPDEARLQLGVQSIAASAAEARRANRDKMARVSAALARFGVKPDDLHTRSLTLQRIDYGSDKGRFRADNLIEVKLRAMGRVGEAVAGVTEAGANVLSGPELRIADREASSRSAYAAAYRAARGRAEAYAEAAGLKVARVLEISDGGEAGSPPPEVRMMTVAAPIAMQASPPPVAAPPPPPAAPFNAGVSSQQVQVRVAFALAPR